MRVARYGKGYSSDNSGDGPMSYVLKLIMVLFMIFAEICEYVLCKFGLVSSRDDAVYRSFITFDWEFYWEYKLFYGWTLKIRLSLNRSLCTMMRLVVLWGLWYWFNKYLRRKILQGVGFSSDDSGDGPVELKKHEYQFDFPPLPAKADAKPAPKNSALRKYEPDGDYEVKPPIAVKAVVGNQKPEVKIPNPGVRVGEEKGHRNNPSVVETKPISKVDSGLKQLQNAYQETGNADNRVSHSREFSKKRNIPKERDNKEQDNKVLTGAARRLVEKEKVEEARQSSRDKHANKVLDDGELTIVQSRISEFGWNGQEVVIFKNESGMTRAYGVVSTELYPFVMEGSIIPSVGEKGVGWVRRLQEGAIRHNPSVRCLAVSAVSEMSVDEDFELDGLFYTGKHYKVFTPLLEWYRKQVSVVVDKESTHNVMMSAANRFFPGLDMDIISQTIQYYTHDMNYLKYLKIKGIGKTIVSVEDRDEVSYLASRQELPFRYGEVIRNNSENCNVPDTYVPREDIVIEHYDTITHQREVYQHKKGDAPRYPVFNRPNNGEGHKYYRSSYFQLKTTNQKHFTTYAVNDVNASKALKRIVGSRGEDDRLLTSMQYSMFCHIWSRSDPECSIEDKNKFLEASRMRMDYSGDFAGYFSGVEIGDTVHLLNQRKIRYKNPVTNPKDLPWFSLRGVLRLRGERFTKAPCYRHKCVQIHIVP